ncbi:hypothetical protein [Tardiphaga sp.]|uniref:hypothetical protein n=1 Tax=Tardiphaga sp. TaxID=1926292 RepID=UPI00261D1A0A|nr:hypothetical protein [Tardiphaga sp.]
MSIENTGGEFAAHQRAQLARQLQSVVRLIAAMHYFKTLHCNTTTPAPYCRCRLRELI